MNWRRGLLLAGINLAIVTPQIVWQEAIFWRYTGASNSVRSAIDSESPSFEEVITFSLGPCEWFFDPPHSMEVGSLANLPVAVQTGWYDPCVVRTAFGRVVGRVFGAKNHRTEIAECLGLSLLMMVQWILVGGFPLTHRIHWWSEPGAFMTTCTTIAACIALVPVIEGLARLPALFAACGWLWWLGLLLWKTLRFAWQSTVARVPRLTH